MTEPLTDEEIEMLRAGNLVFQDGTDVTALFLATIDSLKWGHGPDGEVSTTPVDVRCPECGEPTTALGRSCETCGASVCIANYSGTLVERDKRIAELEEQREKLNADCSDRIGNLLQRIADMEQVLVVARRSRSDVRHAVQHFHNGEDERGKNLIDIVDSELGHALDATQENNHD